MCPASASDLTTVNLQCDFTNADFLLIDVHPEPGEQASQHLKSFSEPNTLSASAS
jgi:hypothetical protein